MPHVEIKLDISAFDGIGRSVQDAALETVGALRTEIVSGQVIPFDSGNLQDSVGAIDQFQEAEGLHTTLCIGDMPYARRLYFNPDYNFQRVNNPNAQGEWAEPWLPGGDLEGFAPETFEERLKEKLSK